MEDLAALQRYVTATDSTQYANLHPDTIVLDISHSNLKQRHIEIRLDKHTTISSLRDKIYQQTGTPPHYQHLQIKPSSNSSVVNYEILPEQENERMLGYFSLIHGMTVHCIDIDPHSGSKGGAYEDTSLVKRYVMSDEDYEKRKGTLRDWGKQQKARDESFTFQKHAKEHKELGEAKRCHKVGLPLPMGFEVDEEGNVIRSASSSTSTAASKATSSTDVEKEDVNVVYGPDSIIGIEVGMRCEASPGNRRGSIAYVGIIPELGGGGHWVGVIFDEPVGKTNGTTKEGTTYFEAPGEKYGGFLRGKNVTVGDFPELDILDELDSDSEDEL